MGGTNSARKATINKVIVRQYKAEGHTNRETAEHFGISFEYTKEICKGMGAPEGYVNQYTVPEFDNIENVKAWVKRCNPDMEYEGSFVNFDSPILIRCTKCGDIFSRSMVSIRHGRKTICMNCRRLDMEERERLHAEEITQRRAEAHAKIVLKREHLKLERKEARRHDCPVCGQSTTRRVFCSKKCCEKAHRPNPTPEQRAAHNAKHDAKRRSLMEAQMVDADISLPKLFRRDHGICWICGEKCDYSDHTRADGIFVAGNSYPSIDHVKALSEGGAHAWDNVRLAHRICNTKRFWGRGG